MTSMCGYFTWLVVYNYTTNLPVNLWLKKERKTGKNKKEKYLHGEV